jgi:hypothetical protein
MRLLFSQIGHPPKIEMMWARVRDNGTVESFGRVGCDCSMELVNRVAQESGDGDESDR